MTIPEARLGLFESGALEAPDRVVGPADVGRCGSHLVAVALVLSFLREQLSDYRPHVTLCRKAGAPLGLNPQEAIEWRVNDFGLAVSKQTERGSVYSVLEKFAAGI